MALLQQDILLDDFAFTNASRDMARLKQDASALKRKMEKMYNDLTTAMDTAAGEEVEVAAKDVLLQPIEDLSAVIQHVSETLTMIIGTGYYKDIFIQYEKLNG